MIKRLFRCFAILFILMLALCAPALADRGELTFSLESGFYDYPMPLDITCDVNGAKIYYTTDGSIPDETDLLYDGTITLMWTTEKEDPMSQITGITLGETRTDEEEANEYPNAETRAVLDRDKAGLEPSYGPFNSTEEMLKAALDMED